MKLHIKQPPPHSKMQELIMRFFATEGSRELWVACGSKFGKSISAAVALTSTFPLDKQGLSRWIAPYYHQSKIGFRYCQRMLPGEPYVLANQSDLSLKIPANDSTLQFFHGQNVEAIEGDAVKRYVFDEFAKQKATIYDAAQTTMTFTKGKAIYISTPRGKNHFYKKCMLAKAEMIADIKAGRVPKKLFITAPTSANPLVDLSIIEDARRNLPDRLFRQYYLAEFVDDGSVFSGFRDLIKGKELEFYPGSKQAWTETDADKIDVVIGADWAKTTDFTVFTAWSYTDRIKRLVGFERFQHRDYRYVIKDLVRFAKKFHSVAIVYHDKTGLGTVIDDLLSDAQLPFEGITFTNDSKTNMINTLMISVQNKEIELPNWPDMLLELDAFEVTTTELGKMKYSAPSGMHDDIVSSMMLGFAAVNEFGVKSALDVRSIDDLEIEQTDVNSWYNEMIEEDED